MGKKNEEELKEGIKKLLEGYEESALEDYEKLAAVAGGSGNVPSTSIYYAKILERHETLESVIKDLENLLGEEK